MHSSILGARLLRLSVALLGSATCATAIAQPPAACPRAPREVVERFISADCERCWQDGAGSAGSDSGGWRFDWILPSAAGEAAPLALAALDESRERGQRAGIEAPTPDRGTELRAAFAAGGPALRLLVRSGPAWNGYLALQYEFSGRAPAGSSIWMAIVESVPAGDDGTPIARELVRAVAGPFAAASTTTRAARASGAMPLVAVRLPSTPQPQRLEARAWLEASDGRMLAIAGEQCPWPSPRR